jgi:hypothetical protein
VRAEVERDAPAARGARIGREAHVRVRARRIDGQRERAPCVRARGVARLLERHPREGDARARLVGDALLEEAAAPRRVGLEDEVAEVGERARLERRRAASRRVLREERVVR